MNKAKHLDVKFCPGQDVANIVNSPRFMSLEEFEGDSYEVVDY